MSLTSTINKKTYDGNAFATDWPFPFPVLEANHLAVIFADIAGVETTLSPSLYMVTGIGDAAGGSVTYPLSGSPIAIGTKLTIVRTVPYTQTTVLSNQGGYYPEVVEQRFDQIYMALQQLEERVSRYTLSSISNPATEQSNYALIQALQQMNLLTTQGDLLTREASAYKRLGRGTAGQFLGVSGADLAWAIPSQPVAPQGRLTLSSGEPVMTADQTGKTSLFFTPYTGSFLPIHDGTTFVATAFTERSNDLTQSATGKAGPAAAGPYQCIDTFVWNDAGTVRLTRGPKWVNGGAFTISIASPGVVTRNGHGLSDGATWRATATTGALPTGIALNTDYFVTRIDANTFRLSTTLANQVAGTYINTSGSQSGTHTGENYTTTRGTGAGTTELELLNGVWVNKVDIVNGPAARMGTYVGTIYTNASSQIDFKLGSLASGGGEAVIGLWNTFNRVDVGGAVQDTQANWTYNGSSARVARLQAAMRASFVSGLREDFCAADYTISWNGDASINAYMGVAFNSTAAMAGVKGMGVFPSSMIGVATGKASSQLLGFGYATAMEQGNIAFTVTWQGGGNAGMTYNWRY